MSTKKNYHIGCSGYYYPAWKNIFYPKGLQPKNWLTFYSSVFDTVELNGTFYRTPRLTDLKKYYAAAPGDFKFSVKVSKYISHILKLKDSKDHIIQFQDLIMEGLEDKLNYFLFQLPPSFHYNEENLARILDNIPHKQENVVELRHISWWNPEVQKAFKKAKLTFCNVDFPGMDTYFINTSPVFYLRMHGNPVLFKSLYSQEQLVDLYKSFPPQCGERSIYFNNTYYDAGFTNASQLKEIIKNA